MGAQYDEGVVYSSFPQGTDLSAATNRYRAVTLNSDGQLVLNGNNSIPVGFIGMLPEGDDTGRQTTVIVDAYKHFVVAAGAIAVGALVRTAANGEMATSANPAAAGTGFIYGRALEAATAKGDIILVAPIRSGVAG